MTKITKNDFIELDFTATTEDGTVFDTTLEKDAKAAGLDTQKSKPKPSIISVGNKMLIPGLDQAIEGKEIGKEYNEEIQPDQAFGKRNPSLVRMISLRQFKNQNILPQKGMQFNLDGQLAKIVSVSGGRVLVDFNNPLAGKKVKYKFKIKRKITDQKEKVNSLQEFFFRKNFPFTAKDKTITFKVDKNIAQYISMMSKSFEDILGMKINTEIIKKKEIPKDKKISN